MKNKLDFYEKKQILQEAARLIKDFDGTDFDFFENNESKLNTAQSNLQMVENNTAYIDLLDKIYNLVK